jgi:hypothetical protein
VIFITLYSTWCLFSLIAVSYVIMIFPLCSDESVTAGSSDENDENANQQVLLCV